MKKITKAPHPDIADFIGYDPKDGSFIRKNSPVAAFVGKRADKIVGNGYARISFRKRLYEGQRLAWFLHYGVWPNSYVDHINGDPTDNRIENLRLATASQNNANSKGFSPWGKGVSLHRSGKFQAQIHVGGKCRYLGLHDSKEAAHAAYIEAAKEHFGEFAREV